MRFQYPRSIEPNKQAPEKVAAGGQYLRLAKVRQAAEAASQMINYGAIETTKIE
jgi:hypothetical protein